MSNTFILTWNPTLWPWPTADFDGAVRRTEAGDVSPDQWSVGARRTGIAIGDRAFLLRQQSDRGIVASGHFTSEIFWAGHWNDSGDETTYAKVAWDSVVYSKSRITTEDLKQRVPTVSWDRLQGSGVRVPAPAAEQLESMWGGHLEQVPVLAPEEPKDIDVYREAG